MAACFESVSTWRQPPPESSSPRRRELVARLAEAVDTLSAERVRVAIDGRTTAGKTTLAGELAAALRARGRPTARASFDDFKHPWSHARSHGYDRQSGAGYYRNAYDFASAIDLLLQPAGPAGSGRVVLCAHDPLTGTDHRDVVVQLPQDAVLIVDSVFAVRPEFAPFWDYRIWLQIDADLAIERGVARDGDQEGADEAVRLHRDRYSVAAQAYLAEVDAPLLADVIIDNTEFDAPRIVPRPDFPDPAARAPS